MLIRLQNVWICYWLINWKTGGIKIFKKALKLKEWSHPVAFEHWGSLSDHAYCSKKERAWVVSGCISSFAKDVVPHLISLVHVGGIHSTYTEQNH